MTHTTHTHNTPGCARCRTLSRHSRTPRQQRRGRGRRWTRSPRAGRPGPALRRSWRDASCACVCVCVQESVFGSVCICMLRGGLWGRRESGRAVETGCQNAVVPEIGQPARGSLGAQGDAADRCGPSLNADGAGRRAASPPRVHDHERESLLLSTPSPAVSLARREAGRGLGHSVGDVRGQRLGGVADAQGDDLGIGVRLLVGAAPARDLGGWGWGWGKGRSRRGDNERSCVTQVCGGGACVGACSALLVLLLLLRTPCCQRRRRQMRAAAGANGQRVCCSAAAKTSHGFRPVLRTHTPLEKIASSHADQPPGMRGGRTSGNR
jgi:hypothetical protein